MNALNTRRWGPIDTDRLTTWQIRALAVIAAVVLNAVILTVGRLLFGQFPVATVGSENQTIGYGQVIGMTAVSGLVAWGLLEILERRSSRPVRIWTAVAGVMFVLSLLGPLDSGVDIQSKVVLTLLHIGAIVAIVPLMRNSSAAHR